jgi:hypothetical protein
MSGMVPGSLLNKPQQQLYARLVRAFPGHVILAHVGLAQLLDASAVIAAREAGPRPRQGTLDFVVCKPDFTAIAVVEIDGPGAHSDAQRYRDLRRDEILRTAGIKVLRVPAFDLPPEAALKALIAALPAHSPADRLIRRAS